MSDNRHKAPGEPGTTPQWTSSAKSGIGKAINGGSQVAFTLGQGVVNEVYYPREDIACIKEMGFAVTDGAAFFSNEKIHTEQTIKMAQDGVPAYVLTNTCLQKKYSIKKEIITDPFRNTLLQKVSFKSLVKQQSCNLYVLLWPHINNLGNDNNGHIGEYKGVPMLFAAKGDLTLALACSEPWLKRSVGYAGTSDGWTDLATHKQMTCEYDYATEDNIVLTGQIDISKSNTFFLAVGFGRTAAEAGNNAHASLLDGFDLAKERYVSEWKLWQKKLGNVKTGSNGSGKLFRTSATVLRVSEAKSFPGGLIASIAIPWGRTNTTDFLSGYHVVWPRDLVESCGGFIALKAYEDALRILNYLMSTQQADGSWPQNMWLDGEPYWKGVQMDQVALPVILMENCYQHNLLDDERMKRYWPVIKKALSFLVTHGPATQQDRWEQQAGLSPYTLATEITGLLAGAHLAHLLGEEEMAAYCRETADYWNSNIENWTYVTQTSLAKKYNVEGYYIRINPHNRPAEAVKDENLGIHHHRGGEGNMAIGEVICVDALALVRFGLRAPDDERIINTIKVIDATLRTETPYGAGWHRFTKDGYGENAEGDSLNFDGTGIGRCWPLLTGERAHYEIAAGNLNKARSLLGTMEAFANNGLLPEQVWDTKDIPEKDLYFGRHTKSAMPLTWAHAEYIKLSYSLQYKKVFDLPSLTYNRYIQNKIMSPYVVWRFNWMPPEIQAGAVLRIEVMGPATIRWTDDDWQTTHDTETYDTHLGIYLANIKTVQKDKNIAAIRFTFFWQESNKWENRDFAVIVVQQTIRKEYEKQSIQQ